MRKLIILLVIAALLMAGCQKNAGTSDTEEGQMDTGITKEDRTDYTAGKTMLFSYSYGVTGTPMQQPYIRVSIYTYDDEHQLLERCDEGGMEDEKVKGYLIPADSYDKVLAVIKERGMDHWEDEEGFPISGAFYNCVFMIDGELHRATSDNMPEDGFPAFSAVESAAYSLIGDNELLYERYTDPDYLTKQAEELEGTVKDEEELLSYLKTRDLTRLNCKRYLTVTTGMGSHDEDHKSLDRVHNYILVRMKPGYYPYTDLQAEYTFTVMRETGVASEEQGTLDGDTYWGYDTTDEYFRAHPTSYDDEDIGSFRDVKVKNISGKVAYFDIPKDLIHEDDYGKFFYYQGKKTRYYLNGFTGYTDYEGDEYTSRTDLWVKQILYAEQES